MNSTTEALLVVQFTGRKLGPSGVAKLAEPRGAHGSARLPKGEWQIAPLGSGAVLRSPVGSQSGT